MVPYLMEYIWMQFIKRKKSVHNVRNIFMMIGIYQGNRRNSGINLSPSYFIGEVTQRGDTLLLRNRVDSNKQRTALRFFKRLRY